MYSPNCLSLSVLIFWVLVGDVFGLLSEALCFPLAADNLLRKLPAEVSEDDTEDLHEIPGVPHPAERGSGSQGRTAQPTSLEQSAVLRFKLCQEHTGGFPLSGCVSSSSEQSCGCCSGSGSRRVKQELSPGGLAVEFVSTRE